MEFIAGDLVEKLFAHFHFFILLIFSHSVFSFALPESTIGLPYHMPEPKGIDQFFKRRVRPDRPAMALLK